MGYQSRKRHYTSRLERYQKSTRVLRIVALFVGLGLMALLVLRWQRVWDYLKTYFY